MFTWTPLIHCSIQEGVYVYVVVYHHLHYNESICWSSTTISSPSLASLLLTFKLIIQRQRADSWYRITEVTVSIQCLCQKRNNSNEFILRHYITPLLNLQCFYEILFQTLVPALFFQSMEAAIKLLCEASDCGKQSLRNKLSIIKLDYTRTQITIADNFIPSWFIHVSDYFWTFIRLMIEQVHL